MTENRFDLEERTSCFGEGVIIFCKRIPQTVITIPIIKQLIRSGTSVGANYREANGASSRKDFKNKIHICKKEAQETFHWLRMVQTCVPDKKNEVEILTKEVQELIFIFGKIISSLNNPKN